MPDAPAAHVIARAVVVEVHSGRFVCYAVPAKGHQQLWEWTQ
jgi:hypothetical protein